MDAATFISPKPNRSSVNNNRNLNLRTIYERKSLKLENEVSGRHFPASTTTIKESQYSLNETKNADNKFVNPFKVDPDSFSNECKLQINLFDGFENSLAETSCHDEIFSILNDITSFKSSIFSSSEELNTCNFYRSSDPDISTRKRLSPPLRRPENPAFKNLEVRDFLENMKKSLSEDFLEM